MSTSATNPSSAAHAGIKHTRSNSNSSTEHPSKSTQQQQPKRQLRGRVEIPHHETNTASSGDLAPMTPATAAKPGKQGQKPQQQIASLFDETLLSSTLDDTKASKVEARMRSSEAKKQKHGGGLTTPERHEATSENSSSAKRPSGAMDVYVRMEGTLEHEQHEHDRPKKKTRGDRGKRSDESKAPIKPKEPKEPTTSRQTIPSSKSTDSKDPTKLQKPKEGLGSGGPGPATQHEIKTPKVRC